MSLTLFGQNLLELAAATVSVSPAAAELKPVTRVYDRDKGLEYEGGSAAQTDIDIDLGSAQAVTGLALVNHNITGVTVTLYGDSSSPATTSRATIVATGVDAVTTFDSLTLRYWRVRIPAMAPAPTLGELLLGVPRVITQNPTLPSGWPHTVGNVARWRSPGGYAWAAQLGEQRAALPYEWRGLSTADLTLLESAFADCDQGAKPLLVQAPDGTLRWMSWLNERLTPAALGDGLFDIAIELEEAL